MSIAKHWFILIIGLFMPLMSFAGSEDWVGNFTFKASDNSSQSVVHTPSKVQFLFFSAGECIKLGKGAKINGIEIKENVSLCRKSKVEEFTAEVNKLGPILNKSIKLGPTYQ